MITPREVLDISVAQLEVLAAFLGEQLEAVNDERVATETRSCNEILGSIRALIVRVHASRRGTCESGPAEPGRAAFGP